MIIPKEHELRQLNELVDFSFVDEMLCDTYTLDNGRPGYRPQVMFKYLILKRMYELSDRDVVSRAMTDMAFKYFLGIAPEDNVIDPSSLTKFRKLRMKDDSIMDIMILKKSLFALPAIAYDSKQFFESLKITNKATVRWLFCFVVIYKNQHNLQ
jgi:hypothetical protein